MLNLTVPIRSHEFLASLHVKNKTTATGNRIGTLVVAQQCTFEPSQQLLGEEWESSDPVPPLGADVEFTVTQSAIEN